MLNCKILKDANAGRGRKLPFPPTKPCKKIKLQTKTFFFFFALHRWQRTECPVARCSRSLESELPPFLMQHLITPAPTQLHRIHHPRQSPHRLPLLAYRTVPRGPRRPPPKLQNRTPTLTHQARLPNGNTGSWQWILRLLKLQNEIFELSLL